MLPSYHSKLLVSPSLEILEDVTGEGLNANYLADYLEAKYKEIYEL
ncbi:hypothetical protein ACT4UM_05055 [Bacillus sp. SS-TM]